MINRLITIFLYLLASGCPCIAKDDNSHQGEFVSSDSIHLDKPCVVREQVSHSKFERITFVDDSCKSKYRVNQGIKHFELSDYIKSQEDKLNSMSLEILNVFTEDDLAAFKTLNSIPIIQCQLTVSKDGLIVNTALIIQAKFSSVISDQRLCDIKKIVTNTTLDTIPYETSAVQFYYGIPRELIARVLESGN